MAETVYYDMGQIRYSENKNYNTPMTMTVEPYNRKDGVSNLNYRDIIFKFNTNLSSVYCINLQIPRNRSYDMVFDLLMINYNNGNADLNNYQFVRRVRVPKQDNVNTGTSTVILYPYNGNNNDVRVGIKKADRLEIPQNPIYGLSTGDIVKVWKDSEGKTFDYYVWTGNTYVQIKSYTDAILTHTWEQELTEQIASYDIVFTNKIPSATEFNCLYLRMERQGFEADIQYKIEQESEESDKPDLLDVGTTYYGLFVDDRIVAKSTCVQLNNWISEDNNGIIPNINNSNTSLNTIGVWSHPDAIMAINGEEIRVGQSGYYELNNFNITNFSMLIRDKNDKFSLDYQYKKNG